MPTSCAYCRPFSCVFSHVQGAHSGQAHYLPLVTKHAKHHVSALGDNDWHDSL